MNITNSANGLNEIGRAKMSEYKTPKKYAYVIDKIFKENPDLKIEYDKMTKFSKEARKEENKCLRNKLNKYIELLEAESADYKYQITKCEDLGFIDMIPTYRNLINTTNEYIEELKGVIK